MTDIVRAVITAYHAATHTADVRPVLGPAAILAGLPVIESCRPNLLAAHDNVAVLMWSDVGGLVLGPWGAVPGDPPPTTTTRSVFVPWIVSDGGTATEAGYPANDGVTTRMRTYLSVPDDFHSTMTAYLVIREGTGTAGNININTRYWHAKHGEVFDTHQVWPGGAYAVGVDGHIHDLQPTALPDVAVGDRITVYFARWGGSGADTYQATLHMRGVLLVYTGVT